jgi:hypothetical protein
MKKSTIIGILLLSLVLAACSGNGDAAGPTYNPYIGGQQGVEMDFIEGLPPTGEGAILDAGRSEFGVGLRLTNVGEYDIAPEDLTLELRGILPAQFTPEGENFDFKKSLADEDETMGEFPGARKAFDGSILEGQFATITFEGLSYQPDSRGDTIKNLQLALCYEYGTQTTTPVCISGDTTAASTDANDQSICAISGAKKVQNSGGPVQITEFKQLPQGKNKISVVFTITHVGQGNIYEPGSVGTDTACDDSITNQKRNKVRVNVSLDEASGADVACTGGFDETNDGATGLINLFEGNPRTVTCTITADESTSIYEDLINIDLEYAYGEETERTIVIKDLGTAN